MVCVWGNKGWRMGNFINLECELFNPKHFQWGSKPKEFSRQIQVSPCDISLKHSKFIKKLLMHRQWQFIQVCLFKQSRVTGLTSLCAQSQLFQYTLCDLVVEHSTSLADSAVILNSVWGLGHYAHSDTHVCEWPTFKCWLMGMWASISMNQKCMTRLVDKRPPVPRVADTTESPPLQRGTCHFMDDTGMEQLPPWSYTERDANAGAR